MSQISRLIIAIEAQTKAIAALEEDEGEQTAAMKELTAALQANTAVMKVLVEEEKLEVAPVVDPTPVKLQVKLEGS